MNLNLNHQIVNYQCYNSGYATPFDDYGILISAPPCCDPEYCSNFKYKNKLFTRYGDNQKLFDEEMALREKEFLWPDMVKSRRFELSFKW